MEKLLSKDWKEKMERLNTSELLAEVKGRNTYPNTTLTSVNKSFISIRRYIIYVLYNLRNRLVLK